MPSSIDVDGVVLVTCCVKHLTTRYVEFVKNMPSVEGWKVHALIGDPGLPCPYRVDEDDPRILHIRCEDSYLHLMKKVAMGIRAVLDMYNVRVGVLRCGDDLVVNEPLLRTFLSKVRDDKSLQYVGRVIGTPGGFATVNNFMVHYLDNHPEDFDVDRNGLAHHKPTYRAYNIVPAGQYISGVAFFLGVPACRALLDHMDRVHLDVFWRCKNTGCMPYLIEDIGVGYVMRVADIRMDSFPSMYSDDYSPDCIMCHTNKYR